MKNVEAPKHRKYRITAKRIPFTWNNR